MKYPKHKPARNSIDNTGIYIIVIFCSFGCKPGFTNNQICIAAKGIVQTIANTVAIEKKSTIHHLDREQLISLVNLLQAKNKYPL